MVANPQLTYYSHYTPFTYNLYLYPCQTVAQKTLHCAPWYISKRTLPSYPLPHPLKPSKVVTHSSMTVEKSSPPVKPIQWRRVCLRASAMGRRPPHRPPQRQQQKQQPAIGTTNPAIRPSPATAKMGPCDSMNCRQNMEGYNL